MHELPIKINRALAAIHFFFAIVFFIGGGLAAAFALYAIPFGQEWIVKQPDAIAIPLVCSIVCFVIGAVEFGRSKNADDPTLSDFGSASALSLFFSRPALRQVEHVSPMTLRKNYAIWMPIPAFIPLVYMSIGVLTRYIQLPPLHTVKMWIELAAERHMYWTTLLVLIAAPLTVAIRLRWKAIKTAATRIAATTSFICPHCDYELERTGITRQCPECGSEVRVPKRPYI